MPLANFVSREPVARIGQIDRVDQTRVYEVKAGVLPGLTREVTDPDGTPGSRNSPPGWRRTSRCRPA